MKKLHYLLLMLPVLELTASCTGEEIDDAERIEITVSNVSCIDNVVYVVAGETITLENVASHSTADFVSDVKYLVDGCSIFSSFHGSPFARAGFPFRCDIDTDDMEFGAHSFNVITTLAKADNTSRKGVGGFRFMVVDHERHFPEGAPPVGTYKINAIVYDYKK